MNAAHQSASALERVISGLLVLVFWTAVACLAAGVTLWLSPSGRTTVAPLILTAGLFGLLLLPVLRLTSVIAAAARHRDWLTLAAALAVVAILCALTLRDAARLR